MRIVYCFICFILLLKISAAQDARVKLQKAVAQFESDSQMLHAIHSLYVIDGKTGDIVFDKNSEIGLAPASCQKLFTSAAAFELLGKDYKYKTELFYTGNVRNGLLKGNISIVGYGDPSLGTWRFQSEGQNNIFTEWIRALKSRKINLIDGQIFVDDSRFSFQVIPGGWIYEDIGNYYGAGAGAINWRENQFDLILRSGSRIGSEVEIIGSPRFYAGPFKNELKAAAKGSGDNAYIYPPSTGNLFWLAKGTIPIDEKNFIISGAIQNPTGFIMNEFWRMLDSAKMLDKSAQVRKLYVSSIDYTRIKDTGKKVVIWQHYSPTFDSLNYWFLRRSINLYGEAFIKTIALEKLGFGSTEKGVELVKDFWSGKGIDKAAINIIDGSGLSPQNRVTTNALVKVLQYTKTRPWYNSFYSALPTYNGIKMKSGSIGGARSFAGYHTSKDGHEYIFAIIVNNYDGSSTAIVNKMYKLLDELK